ncbi:glycine-rich protein-like [Nicotiana tabacum]|uniref:Glycine-rich protein-like n=1 Tax=Nicotiana tabacum TaxID=4097 RepID=A0AC58SK54_TOBAC
MGSKAFLFLGLCLAIFVMISSEVLARELAETSTTSEEDSKKSNNKNEVHEAQYGGGGYPAGYPAARYPVPGGGYPDGGRGGGVYPGGGRGCGGYCRYGCCGRRNYRCCSYKAKKSNNKNEVHEAQYGGGGYPAGYPAARYPVPGGGYPDGGRGGGVYPGGGRGCGGYCRYGCCGRRNYRCCSYKGEAIHG